eukprot:gene21907-biopygen22204
MVVIYPCQHGQHVPLPDLASTVQTSRTFSLLWRVPDTAPGAIENQACCWEMDIYIAFPGHQAVNFGHCLRLDVTPSHHIARTPDCALRKFPEVGCHGAHILWGADGHVDDKVVFGFVDWTVDGEELQVSRIQKAAVKFYLVTPSIRRINPPEDSGSKLALSCDIPHNEPRARRLASIGDRRCREIHDTPRTGRSCSQHQCRARGYVRHHRCG